MTVGLFARNFDLELAQEESADEPVEANNTVSLQEMEEAVQKAHDAAYAAGIEAGRKAGIEETEASITARQADTLKSIASSLEEMLPERASALLEIEKEMSGIINDFVSHGFAHLIEQQRMSLIEAEIEQVCRRAIGSRWLTVIVPEGMKEPASAALTTAYQSQGDTPEVKIIEDPSLEGSSVKAHWQNGRSEYKPKELCKKLIDTISQSIAQRE